MRRVLVVPPRTHTELAEYGVLPTPILQNLTTRIVANKEARPRPTPKKGTAASGIPPSFSLDTELENLPGHQKRLLGFHQDHSLSDTSHDYAFAPFSPLTPPHLLHQLL